MGSKESDVVHIESAATPMRLSIWEGLQSALKSSAVMKHGNGLNTDRSFPLNLDKLLSDRHLLKIFLNTSV